METTFGGRLRMAMAAAAIETAEQLSLRLREAGVRGVHARTVARWMTLEEADLSAKLAYATARLLNVGVAWLIDGYGTITFSPETRAAVAILQRMSGSMTKRWLALGRRMAGMEDSR